MRQNLTIAGLILLAATVCIGLCANPTDELPLMQWLAVFVITKTAAFAAAYGMYKILNRRAS